MAPPPVTPSPHRFIIKNQASVRPVPQQTPLPSTQQFNTVPRFSSTPRFNNPPPTQRSFRNAPPASSPLTAHVSSTSRLHETIEDEFSADEELDEDIHQSIEEHEDIQDQDDIYETEFPGSAAKRRRLNSSPIEDQNNDPFPEPAQNEDNGEEELEFFEGLSSSLTEISSPSVAASYPQTQSKPTPRFLPPSTPQARFKTTIGTPTTPQSSIKPTNTHKIFSKPPRFRPPSPHSQTNTSGGSGEPLPDAFSPRKRKEEYMIGGLASELRSWCLNIGREPSSTSGNRFAGSTISLDAGISLTKGHVQNSRTSPWKFKILVDEISGGHRAGEVGMTLIRGRQINPETGDVSTETSESEIIDSLGQIKIVLAGSGIVDGLNRAKKVDVGMWVGIKGPTWDIEIEGVIWGVVCEWRIL